jgi:predicted ribosomally synthesized peptide with SipW-like signal peptide
MRNIVLSLVMVAALVAAGVGGTLATWSDSETSMGNTITTGSLDLKVNGNDDAPWGAGVGPKVTIDCMIPCKWYGPFEVELWNAGICEFPSKAFIHVKDIVCTNALPKVHPETGESTGYADPSTGQPWSGDLKPEPELVAEYEGKVNCVYVNGIGVEGDDCSMGTHVEMVITTTTVNPTTNNFDDILINPDGVRMRDKLGKWECKEIYLFDLMPCEPRIIYLWFHLQQESEEDFGLDYIDDPMEDFFPDDNDWDEKYLHWQKFNDWPSWAMMRDVATFNMEFDLWLEDC